MANLIFTVDVRRQLSSLGLSESDVHEVFNNGEHYKTPKGGDAVRKYYSSYGYEMGVAYKQSSYNNNYLITFVWKNFSKR